MAISHLKFMRPRHYRQFVPECCSVTFHFAAYIARHGNESQWKTDQLTFNCDELEEGSAGVILCVFGGWDVARLPIRGGQNRTDLFRRISSNNRLPRPVYRKHPIMLAERVLAAPGGRQRQHSRRG